MTGGNMNEMTFTQSMVWLFASTSIVCSNRTCRDHTERVLEAYLLVLMHTPKGRFK